MTENIAQGGGASGDGGDGGGGDGGAAGGGDGGGGWRDSLPADLKDSGALSKYGSIEDALRGNVSLESRLGDQSSYVQKPDWANADSVAKFVGHIRPENAEGYKFETPEGIGVDEGFSKTLAGACHTAGLHQTQAESIYKSLLADYSEGRSADQAERGKFRETELATLRGDWGANFDKNREIVKRATTAGWSEATLKALDQAGFLDDSGFIKGILKFGSGMTEHALDLSSAGGSGFASPEDVRNEINRLMRGEDEEWTKAWNDSTSPGYAAAKERWDSLHEREAKLKGLA